MPMHVGEGWTVEENAPYYRALLFYRGIRDEASTLDSLSAAGELSFVRGAYGVANWHLMEGDTARARALFEQIVGGGSGRRSGSSGRRWIWPG